MKIGDILNKYSQCMEEIKFRIDVVDAFTSGRAHALYEQANMESVCLQLRKILELIALASLVANSEEYSKKRKLFAFDYHAERIIKDIKTINPSYYPIPTTQGMENGMFTSRAIKAGFLTEKELINIYERCGGLLHATNPFSNPKDIKSFFKMVPTWVEKIVKLLNHHEIHISNKDIMFICLMKSSETGKVQVTQFKRVQEST